MNRRVLTSRAAALFACSLMLTLAPRAAAVAPNLLDDFQSGTTLGWIGSPTSNVSDAGPAGAGDNALLVSVGNRAAIYNQSQWTGNYIGAGITKLAMDVRNVSQTTLQLRIGIANGAFGPGGDGDTYVSVTPITVPTDNAWRRIEFDMSPSAFSPHNTNTNPAPSAAAALAALTHLRILHNPNPNDFRGATGALEFYLDNIQAVPEPAGGALAALGFATLAARRRRRR